MHQFFEFTKVSEITAVILTLMAPAVASIMKSAQVRRRFHFSSGDELRVIRRDMSANPQGQAGDGREVGRSEVAHEVILSEEESKTIMSQNRSFAALSAAEIKVVKPKSRAGKIVLIGFGITLLLFGAANLIFYWSVIRTKGSLVLWALGLLVMMVAGMFVQVLSSNFRSGNPLFSVGAGELIFPVLFSPIVFYPIWGLASNGSQSLFSYYAAFLNGYFWQAVVSATRVPTRE